MDVFDRDDVDVIFARLERAPAPAGLRAGVLKRVASRASARRWLGYTAIVTSLLLALTFSFFVGGQLQSAGALSLLTALLGDFDLVTVAAAGILFDLVDLVPWLHVGVVLLSLAALAAAARLASTPALRYGPRQAEQSTGVET